MRKTTTGVLVYAAFSVAAMAAPLTLSVLEWQPEGLSAWPADYQLEKAGRFSRNGITVALSKRRVQELEEWRVAVENDGPETARLCFRFSMAGGGAGGVFWDGFEIAAGIVKTVHPKTERYVFPAIAYVSKGTIAGIGYAPMTISSRFERAAQVDDGMVKLILDSYMALDAGQKDEIRVVSYGSDGAADYTEFVEQIYLAYPDWFLPVRGADERIYGVGGYFFSSEDNRDYQMEEARRYGFDWEWYYNCYQKSGSFYPRKEFWEDERGYKSEPGSLRGKCDRPGTLQDWKAYNTSRIEAGNRNAAMFYYYLQQYCSSDLLKEHYAEAVWRGVDGKALGPVFGWADEGNAQYAWPLRSTLGHDIREQLAMLWRDFPIAGFALDCALGHTRYYGPLLKKETGKAFDDSGKIYATEGVALAYNLDYSHSLPARADGKRPASVINEFYTWLPMFHADGGIHEMTPFDRADLLAPRRLIAGQKPYYFWKGFRADALLKWDELTEEETREGVTGIVDYTLLSSLRFGIIPAVFYVKGFPDVRALNPILRTLLKAGWRASGYVTIDGREAPDDPFGLNEEIWISRFGNGDESYVVLSAPNVKGVRGRATIHTGRFGASGAIYAAVDGRATVNEVRWNETSVDIDLKNRAPLILRKIAVVDPVAQDMEIEASCSVRIPGEPQTAGFRILSRPAFGVERIKSDWPRKSVTGTEVVFEEESRFRFIPDDEFIADIVLGDTTTVAAAIAVSPRDLAGNPEAVKLLEIYYDYYLSRMAHPVHRLADMTSHWNKEMRLPVLAPDRKELEDAKVVFVVGKEARTTLLPGTDHRDAICGAKNGETLLIAFCPGTNSSVADLVMRLFERMDETYPFSGGIKTKWALKAKLYGKVFKKEQVPDERRQR